MLCLLLGSTVVANQLRMSQPVGKNNEVNSPGFCVDPGGACPF